MTSQIYVHACAIYTHHSKSKQERRTSSAQRQQTTRQSASLTDRLGSGHGERRRALDDGEKDDHARVEGSDDFWVIDVEELLDGLQRREERDRE